MKRILLISQNFYPEIGSGANRMKNLYKHFKEEGYDVHILTTEPSYPNARMYQDEHYWDDVFLNDESSHKIIRLHMRHEKQKHSFKARLYYYLEFMMKVHYFVRHTNHLFKTIYITTPNIFAPWGALFFQPDIRATKILEVRDLWPDSVVAIDKINIKPIMPLLQWMEKRMYLKSDKIIINNQGFYDHIHAIAPEHPILYIPNSMNRNEIQVDKTSDEFSVVYTGNIGFAQNYEQLKELAEKLEEKKIIFNVVPYGYHANDFREEALHYQYVNVLPTMTRKECLTFISKHHLSVSILKENDVFLNVLPGKVVDSICAHVPVVTNLGGYVNRLINDRQVGFAKEAATVNELVNAIEYYSRHKDALAECRENTKMLAEEIFSWDKNIKKIIQFMR